MNKKTILVTGGTGFIGRNIVEFMKNKHHILSPCHSELDLLDEDKVKRYFYNNEINVVIHCAVKPGHRNVANPSGQLYANTRMFFNLVRESNKYEKMIYLSSGLVYDLRYYQPKMKEEYFNQHVPSDEGGFSKYIISKYIEDHKTITELRVFGIFGKYEDYAIRFISNIICKAIYGLPLTINQNRLFDYIYINDFMPILDHFIDNSSEENVFNVTPNKAVELLEIAKKIKTILNTDLPIEITKKGMGPEYSGDNSRLRKEIPNLKLTKLDTVIKELYDWYSENKELVDKESLMINK